LVKTEKICKNCNKSFVPKKNDVRIKFCCAECRVEYRTKTNYMATYYKKNKSHWDAKQASPEYKNKKNSKRNERYRTDEVFRLSVIKRSKEYRIKNPTAKRQQDLRRYGLTIELYDSLLAKQGGGCAICGRKESGDSKRRRLFVDHDHATGKVRGLLCASCNYGLGNFKDDIRIVENALAYLRRGDEVG